MKMVRYIALLLALALPAVGMGASLAEESELFAFRPADCGLQAQKLYVYPFIGLEIELSENMQKMMDSREVFVFSDEDYAGENEISYALLRFSVTTQAQREEEMMSVDILAWEAALEKLGAIGVYCRDRAGEMDALTGCDTHKKLGESTDGKYEYYLSTNSAADASMRSELEASAIFIDEMDALDMSMGYSAFSENRIAGVESVGSFSTEDVFGNAYSEEIFSEHELTLVNLFTTWCSPCVQEIPELEELRAEYEEKGIDLGVVAVVMDARTASGVDEGALEQARLLYEKSGAQFPFLIPDEGKMNGRLAGVESYPESFFVDKYGNIVSEPYIGANSKAEWAKIVDAELAAPEDGEA